MHDVIVIGGGIIGLSIARKLREKQVMSVLVLDRDSMGEGASWAAAGMLSPQSEADGQGSFFELCMASLRMYGALIHELREETHIDMGHSAEGSFYLAPSEESARGLKARYESQRKANLKVEFLSPEEVRRMEPLVDVELHGALYFPDDVQVPPRSLIKALKESCMRRGVEIRSGAHVDAVVKGGVRIGGGTFRAGRVIVASGVWSAELAGLDPPVPLRPRKGQILSLNMPGAAFRHMIRWEHGYFVPRPNGELVVGATDEDAGFDRTLTSAGLGVLLSEARRISSRVSSYPLREMWTGLRPATPDGLPIIGESAIPGVYYATGHYRNGILLAPITASIIAALTEDRKPALPIDPYSPARFAPPA